MAAALPLRSPPMNDEPPLLNVRQAATLLGVHENTIRNWLKAGILQAERYLNGRRYPRFAVSELERMRGVMQQQEQQKLQSTTEYRYRNALLWIRVAAGMHYFGGAFDPEHMRAIANLAADALSGKDIKDYESAMERSRAKARKWADRLGFELTGEEDDDDDSGDTEAQEPPGPAPVPEPPA
jgi:excisionase family DNA binding protein